MGIENAHKLIVNCLPLNESERQAFAKAARDVPQKFVGDESRRGDMVWSASVPEELRAEASHWSLALETSALTSVDWRSP